MMFSKRNRIFITIFTLLSMALTPGLQAYTTHFTDHVANKLLNTYDVIENTTEKTVVKPYYNKSFLEHIKYLFAKTPSLFPINLTPRDKLEITFKQMDSNTRQPVELIDKTFIDKLEIVHGEERGQDHLIHRLTSYNDSSYISTTSGLKEMAKMLTQPTTDVSIIKSRQAVIQ